MYTVDPIYSFRNQYYYNNFRSSNKENESNTCKKPVAVDNNDNRVNFGEHKAAPFTTKVKDFVKSLITGDLRNPDNKDVFIPYYA